MQYLDETVMVDYPHGNSKKSKSNYFATAPSVRREIANCTTSALPTTILSSFKNTTSNLSSSDNNAKDINPVLTPRNKSQVRQFSFRHFIPLNSDFIFWFS